MKYIYSTSQMSKLSLTLCTFSITGSVAGLFLTKDLSYELRDDQLVNYKDIELYLHYIYLLTMTKIYGLHEY